MKTQTLNPHIRFLPRKYDGIGPGYVVCVAEWVEEEHFRIIDEWRKKDETN